VAGENAMSHRLRTIIRVTDLEATIRFFALMGLTVVQGMESEEGRYPLIFLAPEKHIGAPGEISAEIELIYKWGPQEHRGEQHLGRLADRVRNVYGTCRRRVAAALLPEPLSVDAGGRRARDFHGQRIVVTEPAVESASGRTTEQRREPEQP
jgi:catechol 2,3-dioxygenase-like lactoylglutathione lyase family enzyme